MSNVSVKFICNGVDLDCSSLNVNRTLLRKSIGVSGQTILIGSIGRLKAIKGYDVLIEALLKIRCSKHVSVILIGSGEDQQKLQTQVNESGLRDRVYFLGEQQNPKELISNVDLYIQPSRSEGIPISVLEAMACGLPIIATDVGGVADILGDGKFGVLVPPNNPNELALAIENLCNDDQLRRHFSIMSLERVQEFSLSKMCNEYLEVYQKEGW